jgi:ATP-binding protein involved in chromosome partitioning
MFRNDHIRIPLLGLVENMSYFTPPDDPAKKYFIFGKSGCKKLADDLKIPLLAQIPIVPEITESGDSGCPVATEDHSPVAMAFMQLAEAVAQQVAIQNAIKESFRVN